MVFPLIREALRAWLCLCKLHTIGSETRPCQRTLSITMTPPTLTCVNRDNR